jgi:hypothetical protein
LITSENSTGPPDFRASRISRALASASDFCARGGELAVDVAELLVRQHGVVVADEQVGLGAILLDLGLGVGEPHPHPIDLAGQPCAGRAGLVLLGGLLQHQVAVGHRVGDLRGKLGILRLELDRDDA